MTPAAAQKWAVTRKNGLAWYVVVRGILSIGVLFATLILFADYFFETENYSDFWKYVTKRGTWIMFVWNALVFGLIMGLVNWFGNERAFRNSTKTSPISKDE